MSKRTKITQDNFGAIPTSHMFVAEYSGGKWTTGKILPFQDLSLSPFTSCLHYGQTVFEGLKAFKQASGEIGVFRQNENHSRLNKSLERMGMPELPYQLWKSGIFSLIKKDKKDFEEFDADIIYIRPFVIATENRLGVKIAQHYKFIIVMCPVGEYYSRHLKVLVEEKYSRAAPGGTGYAKCGGNYGASFYPFKLAKEKGFDQIIWTDPIEHKYIEESGTMNIGFIIDNTFITPAVSETILDGITRKSIIQIAEDLGMKIRTSPISVKEIIDKIDNSIKVEAFGIGTAAGIIPFKEIGLKNKLFQCYTNEDAKMFQLKNMLLSIQKGQTKDTNNWITLIN